MYRAPIRAPISRPRVPPSAREYPGVNCTRDRLFSLPFKETGVAAGTGVVLLSMGEVRRKGGFLHFLRARIRRKPPAPPEKAPDRWSETRHQEVMLQRQRTGEEVLNRYRHSKAREVSLREQSFGAPSLRAQSTFGERDTVDSPRTTAFDPFSVTAEVTCTGGRKRVPNANCEHEHEGREGVASPSETSRLIGQLRTRRRCLPPRVPRPEACLRRA